MNSHVTKYPVFLVTVVLATAAIFLTMQMVEGVNINVTSRFCTGHDFREAMAEACPMLRSGGTSEGNSRRKREVFDRFDLQDLKDKCCHSGCNFVDFTPLCT